MASITTLNASDTGSVSRPVINTNFDNLNTDKIEADSADTLTNKTINTASNNVTVVASDVSDFDTEVANNSAVAANTAKATYPSADSTKLDGIEANATIDQTGAEIKTAYEGEADTNAYTDAEKTKLAGVEAGAEENNISDTNATDLTDGGETTLHSHAGSGGDVEGTEVKSTGETGGSKFLREDGDGTSSWQAIGGGGDMVASNNLSDVSSAVLSAHNIIDGSVFANIAVVPTDKVMVQDVSDSNKLKSVTAQSIADLGGEGDALVADPLSQFAATTSAQLAGVLSDETGSGAAVFGTSPALTTPTGIVASDLADFDTEVANNSAVTANTAKVTYPSADSTKLSGIETSADVTDTANVTSAGALMDSEVTNLAQVKAFDSSDYATSTQGSTADSAMQDLADDTTPQLGGELDAQAHSIGFTLQTATYNATTTTIDWKNGNKAKMTFGAGNIGTLAFTNPTKPCSVQIILVQDGTGSRVVTAWDSDIKWAGGGTAPTLSTSANSVDVVSFLWDGTSYLGTITKDFS